MIYDNSVLRRLAICGKPQAIRALARLSLNLKSIIYEQERKLKQE